MDKEPLQDDIDKLIMWSENGRCYSFFRNVNVYTHDMETLGWIVKWDNLLYGKL